MARIEQTLGWVPGLKLGIARPSDVLQSAEVLDAAARIDAEIITASEGDDGYSISSEQGSAIEFVYEPQLQLEIELARQLLDRNLGRVLAEADDQLKDVLLEVTAALMFSQVRGFSLI